MYQEEQEYHYDFTNDGKLITLKSDNKDLSFNLSRYISMEIDNQGDNVKDILAEKIMTDINTVNEIFDALFNN